MSSVDHADGLQRQLKTLCLFDLCLGSRAIEDFEPERGELYLVVTLLEILIIIVGILAGFVLLKNRKK